jgi:hypothetical protein
MMWRKSSLSSVFNQELVHPRVVGRVRGVRRALLPRIRYYLHYRVSGSTLEVLAFRHDWRRLKVHRQQRPKTFSVRMTCSAR